MRRSTSTVRRACAVGTTIALVGLTTGLGIMTATSASAVTVSDPAVAASSDPATTGTTTTTDPTGSGATGTDPTGPGSTSTDGATAPAAGDATPTDGASTPAPTDPAAPSTDPATPTDGGTTGATPTTPEQPSTTAPTAPAAGTPTDQPSATATPAAKQTVTIEGDLSVGSELVARRSGFTLGSKVSTTWTDETGTVLSEDPIYEVPVALAGHLISVTIDGLPGETATATAEAAIGPVFVDEDGQPLFYGDDGAIDVTAGEAFSYTFHAVSTPAPTLSVQWYDEDGNPQAAAPAGVEFDAATGVVSGTLTDASMYYDFDVTATTTTPSGTVSTTQSAEITVEPGAPVGIEVLTADRGALEDNSSTVWIVRPDGSVYALDLTSDDGELVPGHVTVRQGGTLIIRGTEVDRFGNEIPPTFDDETGEPTFFTPTVTSDVASDVIAADSDPDLGQIGIVDVTFPHASIHTLTVSGAGLQSTSFAVDVRPTAVPAVVPTPPVVPAAVTVHPVHHAATGRLAYTGSDTTGALPWALGLLVAGAGLIGARTLRRRRAQR